MKILKAMKRSPLGLDLYLWLTYRTFNITRPMRLTWTQLYRQFGALLHEYPVGVGSRVVGRLWP